MMKNKDKIWLRKNGQLTLFVVAGVVFIFVFVAYLGNNLSFYSSTTNQEGDVVAHLAAGPRIPISDPFISPAKTVYPRVEVDDPSLGEKKAVVTIFEYASINCPECGRQQQILDRVLKDYSPEEVRLVWKGTATTEMGVLAQQAIYCADLQDKFWDYQLAVYIDSRSLNRRLLSVMAGKLGLQVDSFDSCLDSARLENKIYRNNGDAIDLSIDSLPYFFIDNIPFRGPLSASDLRQLIDYFLEQNK
jgi:protein-disulfide isomerase